MAFQRSNLHLISYGGNGFGLWRYTTTSDAKTAVQASGYFNDAATKLNVGDRIMVTASDGDVDRAVTSNNGTTVETGAIT